MLQLFQLLTIPATSSCVHATSTACVQLILILHVSPEETLESSPQD